MMSKDQALHKAERHFSQLKKLVEQAIDEEWRVDELERSSFAELLEVGVSLLTAFVAAHGNGDQGAQLVHQEQTLHRLEQEGFVTSHGTGRERRLLVAPLTMHDGHEVFTIVGHLEGLAVREAAELPANRGLGQYSADFPKTNSALQTMLAHERVFFSRHSETT